MGACNIVLTSDLDLLAIQNGALSAPGNRTLEKILVHFQGQVLLRKPAQELTPNKSFFNHFWDHNCDHFFQSSLAFELFHVLFSFSPIGSCYLCSCFASFFILVTYTNN